MVRSVTQRFPPVFWAALGCLALGLSLGCAKPVPVSLTPPAATPPSPPVCAGDTNRKTAYDRGVCAYDAGAFQKAVAAWREVLARGTDPAARQKALFALAAVKLAQAGNASELAQARHLLNDWLQHSPPGGSGEDPRFLIPVVRTFHPAFVIRELKAASDRECSKKLVEREQQVRHSLQQQVRALENIHREIQEKKKGLTNY